MEEQNIEKITVVYSISFDEDEEKEEFKFIKTKPEGLESTLIGLDGVFLRKKFSRSFKLSKGLFKIENIYDKNDRYYVYEKIGDLGE